MSPICEASSETCMQLSKDSVLWDPLPVKRVLEVVALGLDDECHDFLVVDIRGLVCGSILHSVHQLYVLWEKSKIKYVVANKGKK